MESDIIANVENYIRSHGLITPKETVCVAVSGGADSMCLLFLLRILSDEMRFSLSAVHIEHGIRGQASLDDMKFVARQCKDLDIPIKTFSVNAVSVAEKKGLSLEEAARNERYRIFSGLSADRIALAHHMNDQAETFLFNSIRGSGVTGLKGMIPDRDKYIRPLLCISRQEIETYCVNNHIEYRQDSTNEDVTISRNRIRHIVIPELEMINDNAVKHIYELTEELYHTEEYLTEMTMTAYDDCVIRNNNDCSREIVIDLDKFDVLHEAIASRVIKRALITSAGRARDVSRRHIQAVLELAAGQSGHHLDLIYGIKVRKEFRKLIIISPGQYELKGSCAADDRTEIDLSPVLPVPIYSVLSKEAVSPASIASPENYTKYIDYATIGDTSLLMVRFRQPGDFISIKNGSKKLKDLMIGEKIPSERRDQMPLIAMGSEIVWIPDLKRIGERFKITDKTTKILRMEIRNG